MVRIFIDTWLNLAVNVGAVNISVPWILWVTRWWVIFYLPVFQNLLGEN